jgi:hypothetical protein
LNPETASIVLGLITAGLSALLAFAYRTAVRLFARRDPIWRPLLLSVLTLVWAGSNLGYYYYGFAGYSVVFVISSVFFLGVIGNELWKFWAMGLVGADRTQTSGIDHKAALSLCHHSLDFLGVGAYKLTLHRREFEAAIKRCQREHQPVRFLLCDPDSQRLEGFARQAGDPDPEYRRRVIESLKFIAHLRNDKNFAIRVRFYSHQSMPLFRLMFIDDTLCLASHYHFGHGEGLDLPQLHVRHARRGEMEASSFYFALREYFDRLWSSAEEWDFRITFQITK